MTNTTLTQNSRDPGSITVSKSNELIHARYRLTVAEQRVLLLCLSKIPYNVSREQVSSQYFFVSSQEFASFCGVNISSAYKEMKSAEERLWQRDFYKPAEKAKFRWVTSVKYSRASIGLRFSEEVAPFLVELSGSYTQYSLIAAMRLQTSFGHRLYEILIATRFRKNFEATIDLDSLRFGMDLIGQYPVYAELRRRVIDPAIKDITNNSDIRIVNVIPRKQDRKVVALTFQYSENPGFNIDELARDVSRGMGLVDESVEATAHRTNVVQMKQAKAKSTKVAAGQGRNSATRLSRDYVAQQAKPGESWEEAEQRLIRAQRNNGDDKTIEMSL